ncbi:hypothetical protein VTN77DRAFT_5972 [Rasamsonia byssochlamydoides]|uniref:uncharacterized protein n=1 Tax=Rasamsonia byssochlamydoides TaxID=89139 RepID=UPI0037449AE3
MGTALDALTTAPQPLTARRPAASNLPTFELPPPASFQFTNPGGQKFPSPSSINPVSNVSVGNLLTPLSSHSGEGTSSLAPGQNVPSTTVSATQDVPSYPSGFWQSQNSYNYSGNSHQSWNQGSTGLFPPPRGGFPPSSGPLTRNSTNPPPVTESMSQSYDLNQLPPFQQQPIPISSPATATPVVQPPPAPQQQQQQQQAMAHAMISAHGISTTSAPSPHQLGASDPYGSKSHSTPLFGGSQTAVTQHQGSYPPPYGGPSPVVPTGLGIHGAPRMPPGSSQSPPMQPPQLGYTRPPWPSYSLPAMNGPVYSNVHNPNGALSMMGTQPGFLPLTSGHLASPQYLYGGHPPHHPVHGQPAPPNDRPFKCDQCPQSFNRNHDLKRHKRIHLSVKPFPCNHCEKSFSRKDALKRHLLVKGCGKNSSSDGANSTKDDDTLTKTDSQSEKASPMSNGHN